MPHIRLNVRAKLLGSAGLLIVLIAVVGVLSILNLGSVNGKGKAIYKSDLVPIAGLGTIATDLTSAQSVVLEGIINAGNATEQRSDDQEIATLTTAYNKTLKQVEPTLVDAADKAPLALYKSTLVSYQAARERVRALSRAGDKAQAIAAEATADHLFDKTRGAIEKLTVLDEGFAKADDSAITSTYNSSTMITLIILIASILTGMAIAYLIARSIVSGLRRVVDAAERVGDGDLTVDVSDVKSRDEIGDLAKAFQAMVERLRGLVGTVSETAGHLSAASQQMASTSEEAGKAVGEIAQAVSDVASGAEKQVRSVEQAKQASEEVAGAAQSGATNAQETAAAAQQARSVSEQGADTIQKATEAMQAVRDSSASVTETIRALGAKSDQIGSIVETITGIAEQTNLLALNAAIEAARAGEQGRGFAVVAEEVRKLAEESQQAAASIANIIEQIQGETQRAVEVVEDGAKRTEEGVATVEQARDAFIEIGSAVEDVSGRVEQIATAIEQIANSSQKAQSDMADVASVAEESSASTEQVSASTEETSASTEQIAASAQELAKTAEELEQLVGKFRVAA